MSIYSNKMLYEAHFTLIGYSIDEVRKECVAEACDSDDDLYNNLFRCQSGGLYQIGLCHNGCTNVEDDPEETGEDYCQADEDLHKNKNGNKINIQIEI